MITGLEIGPFKGFAEGQALELKPITLLCGTNSGGKSSILQGLLLLKQTTADNKNTSLNLDGKYTRLGTISNIIHHNDTENSLNKKISLKLEYTLYDKQKKLSLAYIAVDQKNKYNSVARPLIESFVVIDLDTKANDLAIQLLDVEKRLWTVEYKDFPRHFSKIKSFAGLVPLMDFYYLPDDIPVTQTFMIKYDIELYLQKVSSDLHSIFDKIHYIGPFRELPQRRYTSHEEINIGIKGEYAPHIYQTEQNSIIADYYSSLFADDSGFPFQKQSFRTLKESVDEWLSILGFDELSISELEELFSLYVNSSSSNKQKINIADIGFGFSQIFPIVLEALRVPKHHTLIFEQPELHLHPKLQMKLADFFISMALSGKHLIIETHSEHIVNRLVRRIIEDDSGLIHKLAAMYFVVPGPDGSEIEDVVINEMTGIEYWPIDFFDQAVDEKELIFRSAMKRIFKAKGEL